MEETGELARDEVDVRLWPVAFRRREADLSRLVLLVRQTRRCRKLLLTLPVLFFLLHHLLDVFETGDGLLGDLVMVVVPVVLLHEQLLFLVHCHHDVIFHIFPILTYKSANMDVVLCDDFSAELLLLRLIHANHLLLLALELLLAGHDALVVVIVATFTGGGPRDRPLF